MQLISASSVRRWTKVGPYKAKAPASLSTICPHCGEKAVFTLNNHTDDLSRMAVAADAKCPGCNRSASFWSVRDETTPTSDKGNPAAVYMYPPAKNHYPQRELSADVPEPLSRSLASTIEVFNSRNYVATAVCCRRTLEGIFKYLVSEDKRDVTLYKLIEHAQSTVNLAAPLTTLSHAIRDGGNLGAHFNMEKEPSEPLARQMVELLDYLISYLYELPKQIEKLEKSLGKQP